MGFLLRCLGMDGPGGVGYADDSRRAVIRPLESDQAFPQQWLGLCDSLVVVAHRAQFVSSALFLFCRSSSSDPVIKLFSHTNYSLTVKLWLYLILNKAD